MVLRQDCLVCTLDEGVEQRDSGCKTSSTSTPPFSRRCNAEQLRDDSAHCTQGLGPLSPQCRTCLNRPQTLRSKPLMYARSSLSCLRVDTMRVSAASNGLWMLTRICVRPLRPGHCSVAILSSRRDALRAELRLRCTRGHVPVLATEKPHFPRFYVMYRLE